MKTKDLIQDTICSKNTQIRILQGEIAALKGQLESIKGKKGIDVWLGYQFESSSGLTEEFASFAKDYKKAIADRLPGSYKIVAWNRGHFYISCFIKNAANGKLCYLSISDVRHFPDSWHKGILVRSAKHEKDYTGGSNNYTDWNTLVSSIERIVR